ncbi:unnamed protein product, partial [Ixodes hexagonus]
MTPRLEPPPAKGRQPAGAMAHDESHQEPARAASRNSTNLKRCVKRLLARSPSSATRSPGSGLPRRARQTTWRRWRRPLAAPTAAGPRARLVSANPSEMRLKLGPASRTSGGSRVAVSRSR